jgi:hypothetical protein
VYVTCGSCTPVLGCGWCFNAAGGTCAPDPDSCTNASEFTWTWDPPGCPDVDAGVIPLDAGTPPPDAALIPVDAAPPDAPFEATVSD